MRILIVGLNPSKLNGKFNSIKTLYKWLDYLNQNLVSFTNLHGNYDLFKSGKLNVQNETGEEIRSYSKNYDRIIALGAMVSDRLSDLDISCFMLPHPSGRNRQLNDPKFLKSRLDECKEYLK